MSDRFSALRAATMEAVANGPGTTAAPLRQALLRGDAPEELRAFVEAIRRQAWRITDEEVATLAARHDEDALFEIIVATVLGAADERLRAGLRALEEA